MNRAINLVTSCEFVGNIWMFFMALYITS